MTPFMGKLSSHFTSLTYVTMLGRIAFLSLLHFFRFARYNPHSSCGTFVGRFLSPSNTKRGGGEPLGYIVMLSLPHVGLEVPPFS